MSESIHEKMMRMCDTAFKRVLSRLQPGEKVIIQKLLGESPHESFVLHDDATKQPATLWKHIIP